MDYTAQVTIVSISVEISGIQLEAYLLLRFSGSQKNFRVSVTVILGESIYLVICSDQVVTTSFRLQSIFVLSFLRHLHSYSPLGESRIGEYVQIFVGIFLKMQLYAPQAFGVAVHGDCCCLCYVHALALDQP